MFRRIYQQRQQPADKSLLLAESVRGRQPLIHSRYQGLPVAVALQLLLQLTAKVLHHSQCCGP